MAFALSLLSAFILGMSKAGLKGMGVVIVILMIFAHGARASTGVVLPLLIFADIMAVSYYRNSLDRQLLFRFLPWMIAGVLLGVWFGADLPEAAFKRGMAIIILVSVIIMGVWERMDKKQVPKHWAFAGSMGLAAGFATMVGNLAGAFANVYFLAMRVSKIEFIGTAAWLFFIVNLFKLPFHIFVWGTVNAASLKTNLYLLPAVVLGFGLGLKVVQLFKEEQYRFFILAMTALGALVMLLQP